MRTLSSLGWWHQGMSHRSCLYQILPGTDCGRAGLGSSFFFFFLGLHKNRGREGPAVTFRGCVAPALPWVLCELPALLCFVLSWSCFCPHSFLSPGCWRGLGPPFSGDTGSPSAIFCHGLGGVTVKGTREELSAVRSRGI